MKESRERETFNDKLRAQMIRYNVAIGRMDAAEVIFLNNFSTCAKWISNTR